MNLFFSDVNPIMVKRIQAKGKLVIVWTVNSEQDIKKMIEMKVDGIITDDPCLAVQILGRNK